MTPPQLEGAPKKKWELQLGKPTQSVHPLCGPSPPGSGGVLPARGPLFLMVWEIHPDPGTKVGHGTLHFQAQPASPVGVQLDSGMDCDFFIGPFTLRM
ncbi:hypothetical protein DSO57_1000042 [Entomophthora muscae]|uniref:Uncharacterized protein n=1 Tax=Entomophthora muscae TaxID=34485 RepID=A0ACC2SMA1_9FUNG|nr:hypothetical protein DSO57_1000042 [Entomophthora muscae]